MGPVERPGRALGGSEKVDPPDRAVEGDRDTGVDRPKGLGPVDEAEFQSDSPFRGFLTGERGRVDEIHVPDDYTQGFESERCEHRVPPLTCLNLLELARSTAALLDERVAVADQNALAGIAVSLGHWWGVTQAEDRFRRTIR
jgi:hypothetical protein